MALARVIIPAGLIGGTIAHLLPGLDSNLSVIALALTPMLVMAFGMLTTPPATALPTSLFGDVGPVDRGAVRLRRPTPADNGPLAATIDQEVVASNGWTIAQARSIPFIASLPLVAAENGFLVISSQDDDRVVGAVSFDSYDLQHASIHVGLWIGPIDRGHGLETAAMSAAADLAWSRGLRTLHMDAEPADTEMRRVLDTLGARFVEERPYRLPDRRTVSELRYELTLR